MQKAFTGIKDTDLIILSQLNDKDLLSTCLVNKAANKLCNNENFWRNRFISRYGQEDFEFMKDKVKNWRKFMLLLIKYMDKGRNYLGWAIQYAAYEGQKDLVEFFILKGVRDWNSGLYYASKGGHIDLVDYFIILGARGFPNALFVAAEKGNKDMIDFLIKKAEKLLEENMFISLWNSGMNGAAKAGNKDLVDFFISKGANEWNTGLYSAAEGGNKDMVNFFISRGAKDWNYALSGAIEGKNSDLIEFFKQKIISSKSQNKN